MDDRDGTIMSDQDNQNEAGGMSFPQYSGKIMYPPRPHISIPPKTLESYEKKGFIGQLKFNGTRTLVELVPGGEIKLWTRHREPHKAYKLSDGLRKNLMELHESFDCKEYIVIDGELMHNKTKGLKNTFIAFDLLVHEGNYLIGVPMLERYQHLAEMLGEPNNWEDTTGKKIAIRVREHLWLAETFMFDLKSNFNRAIEMDEIEGLVLKKPNAVLEYGHSEKNNTKWQLRCRKPHKNYQY